MQQLAAIASPVEGPGSLPSTHLVVHISNFKLRRSEALFSYPEALDPCKAEIDICACKTQKVKPANHRKK